MAMAPEQTGIGIRRHFTVESTDPYDEVVWERRDARISNFRDGSVAFEQRDVEFPVSWSQNATNIVAQKYFRGPLGAPERESSLRQVIDRVADTITAWGRKDGYFVDDTEAEAFSAELKHLVLHQKAAFNSPVWFNIGVAGEPQQASACQPYHSLVSTPDGLVPIGGLVEGNWVGTKVFDAHGLTRIEAVKANGRKRVLRVHTKAGVVLDVTGDHLVWRASSFSTGRFIPARDLRPGDKLEWHRASSFGGAEITRREIAEAALAGWLQSDGFVGQYYGTNRSLTIEAMTVTDAERSWVLDAIDRVFPGVHRHERFVATVDPKLDCRRIRLYGETLSRFVEAWSLRVRGVDMTVPERLFTAPLPVVAAYLRSLFQAEGYVSLRERGAVVGLAMISEGLVRGIQSLLLRFGIFSHVRFAADRRPDRKGCWVLSIRSAGDRRLFHDEVGFIDPAKESKLEASFDIPGKAANATKLLEIDRVEDLGEMDVYDIQTESGEYLSENLRVHNCFILAVDDTMRSILNWYVEEGTIFKGGSGSGINLSNIRSSHEPLKGGGTASGPVSFMRGADASAGTIKSGGKTRRAAKMVILNADHPDIEDFIWCKAIEERKARVLRDAGFDMDLDGRDSHSTQYQNANNSVRVTDEFMQAVLDDADWDFKAVTTGDAVRTVKARDLFRQIAEAAWECADPGMQFDTTINRWHTASNTGRINASNPCSEYMHLDNSACNLASLNLMKFLNDDGTFDVDGFKAAVSVVFTAQEILVGNADYPTDSIAETSRRFRQLGLGYANLGAMLMALGMPYDSDKGRAWAAGITALMTGQAYATSACTAARMGPFAGYSENREPMGRVLRMHREEVARIDEELVQVDLLTAAQEVWDAAVELSDVYGVRNSQATVLAPTGCLVGGSLVATDRGLVRLRSLGDPDGPQWQDLDATVATDEGARAASKFYVNGLEPVVTVETEAGHRIAGTAQHRVKVVDPATGAWEWRRFSDLRPGDLVPLSLNQLVGDPRQVPLPAIGATAPGDELAHVPADMTVELAELAGYARGAGAVDGDVLSFLAPKADFEVVERLERLGKAAFGMPARVTVRDGAVAVEFRSARLVTWWEATRLGTASVPDLLLATNDRWAYAAFVRGLFDATGTVVDGRPRWSTSDLDMASDVQSLLLALGYPTTRRAGEQEATLLLCDNSSIGRWLEEVGFVSGRKHAAVLAGHDRRSVTSDLVPVPDGLVERLLPERGRLRKAVLEERSGEGVSRATLVRLHQHTGDPELGRLLTFTYDRVATAELGPEELTYDLSVPENVTYVANGFVSHNTIGLMMDCDTTGIEPDLGLCKTKKLVGGGTMSIVNQTVPRALRRLGYSAQQVTDIVAYIDEHKSIIGAPHLRSDHLPVFACSMGDNVIHYLGHLKMMAAVQPWISGAISKTINVPESVSVEEVEQLHIDAWRMGIKAVAMYRDNCKVAQPLSTTKTDVAIAAAAAATAAALAAPAERLVETVVVREPVREKLPRTRNSKTFSFRVADCHGYVTVGEYDDGRPGEIFLRVAKQGSTLAGIMDAFAISVSHGLQYGVPLRAFVDMYTNMRFEPAGMTDDPDIRFASSLVDYIFRRLAVEYLPYEDRVDLGILTVDERMQPTLPGVEEQTTPSSTGSEVVPDPAAPAQLPAVTAAVAAVASPQPVASDAPYCYQCGMVMQRAGACFVCSSCGTTSGCS
jgi:ribonucleoside-diphosphate reductase alpha chain